MAGPLITAWRRFEHSSDAYLAVTAMLILLIIAPIAVSGFPDIERPLTAALAGLAVGLSMAASNARRWLVYLALLASAIVMAATLIPGVGSTPLTFGILILGLLMVITPAVILNRVARHEHITATTLWGAVSAYLSIGLAFSLFYAAANGFDSAAFPNVEGVSLGDFNYFSFVTMTTLGFGDITPATDIPRALSVLQTILGQIFLVVVVARVVSLLGTDRKRPLVMPPKQGPAGEEHGRTTDPTQ
jgi:hypothetical protein